MNHNHNHNDNNKNETNNNMNTFIQYFTSLVDRKVTTKKNATPGVDSSIPTDPATRTTQKQQTITITNSKKQLPCNHQGMPGRQAKRKINSGKRNKR